MRDTRITLRDTNGQLPGAILFMNFLFSRKDHVRHENYSRDTNGQLPGAILFMNFLSSRKDHVRHENYSQRHKWSATWGYLVYELLIFQERSCKT